MRQTLKRTMLYQRISGYTRAKTGTMPFAVKDVFGAKNTVQHINKYKILGNTTQNSRVYKECSYTCDGTEVGGYYFTVDNVDYRFSMPFGVRNGDKIVFDTYDKQLWQYSIGGTGLQVTAGGITNQTYIEMDFVEKSSPNDIHKEDASGVGLVAEYGYNLPITVCKNYSTYNYNYNYNFREPETIYDVENRRVTVNIPELVTNAGLTITLWNQLNDFNVGDDIKIKLTLYEYMAYSSNGDNALTVRLYNETKGIYIFINFIGQSVVQKEVSYTARLTSENYTKGDTLAIYIWTEAAMKFTVGNFIVTKPSLEAEVTVPISYDKLYSIDGNADEYDGNSGTVIKRIKKSYVNVSDAIPNSKYYSNIKSNCYASSSGTIEVAYNETIWYQTNSPSVTDVGQTKLPLFYGDNFIYNKDGEKGIIELEYQANKKGE